MASPYYTPRAALSFLQEQESFTRFRRALGREDQLILDDLFKAASKHLSAAELGGRALPFERMLLCMLLEQDRKIMRLMSALEKTNTDP
jgi:hypothetical protein